MRFAILILFTFFVLFLEAQIDSHYWTHQYGAKGLLLNGAVIASSEDETNIFYNPGATGLDDNLGFSFSFISPTYSRLQANNFLGDQSQLVDTGLGFSPGFLALRWQPFTTNKITFSIASFERLKSDVKFQNRITHQINETGAFVLRADLDFRRKITEKWFGLGISYNITENLGIGFSHFSTWHSQDLEVGLIKEILLRSAPTDLVASWRSEFSYHISTNSGFVTKLGVSYKIDDYRLGATFTTPTYGILRSSGNYRLDDQRVIVNENISQVQSNRDKTELQNFKSPMSIGLGLEYVFDNICVSFSSEFFSAISEYTIFSEVDDSFNGVAIGDTDISIAVRNESLSVLNVGLGVQIKKNDKVTFLGGFRTDFNQNNSLYLNNNANFLGSAPDIFHLSGGGMFAFGSSVFSIGLDFGFGKSSGGRQLADLTDVNLDNLFTFSGKDNVSNTFFSSMLFITYDFIYNRE